MLVLLIACSISIPYKTNAQNRNAKFDIALRNATLSVEPNIEAYANAKPSETVVEGYFYKIIQFNNIPTQTQTKALASEGILLMNYLPNLAYEAAIPKGYNLLKLTRFDIRSLINIDQHYKLSPELFNKNYPAWALNAPKTIDVLLTCFSNINFDKALSTIRQNPSLTIISHDNITKYIKIRTPFAGIETLTNMPFINYIQAIDQPPYPENNTSRTGSRISPLQTEFLGIGSRNYNGTGMTVAVNDDGFVGPHIDSKGRYIQTAGMSTAGTHGDHTSGTIAGAGNFDPKGRGMAWGATLYVYQVGSTGSGATSVYPAIQQANTLYNNPGIRITSTSYGQTCNGTYNAEAAAMDNQLRVLPNLMHVFSGGNSQGNNCNYGAGAGWGTITGGAKIAKNVLTVAAITDNDAMSTFSSWGPTSDGRLKPEISAKGVNVYSTLPNNTYGNSSGTSMACPGIAGTLTVLNHAFKDLKGIEPNSALMKCIAMNTADDLGVRGPDYKFGYGRINAYRALKVIEQTQYIQGEIGQNGTNTHLINVPASAKQLKIMLYWADPQAAPNATRALVNDLNLTASTPNNQTIRPLVLNPFPNATSLNAPATRSTDSLNNSEQIVIDTLIAGSYTLTIKGKRIPQGIQTYFISYEFIGDEVELTYPLGGEGFLVAQGEYIRWDSRNNGQPYTIDYTTNEGSTWILIGTAPPEAKDFFYAFPVATPASKFKIRVTRGNTSTQSLRNNVISRPLTSLAAPKVCPDSIRLSWTPVLGAEAYEISQLGARYMDSIGVSSTNSFTIVGNFNATTEYYFAARPIISGSHKGRRSIALRVQGYKCTTATDVAVVGLVSPNGIFQNINCLPLTPNISVSVKNVGNNATNNIPVFYSLNNGTPVSGVVASNVPANDSIGFAFAGPSPFATPGIYDIKIWTAMAGDLNRTNDTLKTRFLIAPSPMPYRNNFNVDTVSKVFYTTVNPDSTYTWDTKPAVTTKDGSVRSTVFMNFYDYSTPTFQRDELISPPINTAGLGAALLLFDRAYAPYATAQDSLLIDLITSCNDTIATNYRKNAAQLATAPSQTGRFVPNLATQWKTDTLNLSPYLGGSGFLQIKFIGVNNYGNNLYLDNVRIVTPLGIRNINFETDLVQVYPNPNSEGFFNLYIKNEKSASISIEVKDVMGRLIDTKTISNNLNPSTTATLDLTSRASGIYFAYVQCGDKQTVVKLIKSKP